MMSQVIDKIYDIARSCKTYDQKIVMVQWLKGLHKHGKITGDHLFYLTKIMMPAVAQIKYKKDSQCAH